MQAEDEGDWVFTGGDGEERGPYSLSQLRKLLKTCAPCLGSPLPRSCLLTWLGLVWAAAPCNAATCSGGCRHHCHCCMSCPAEPSRHYCGCRGKLQATDMLHDEEAGVSVQVCGA